MTALDQYIPNADPEIQRKTHDFFTSVAPRERSLYDAILAPAAHRLHQQIARVLEEERANAGLVKL
jgi:hypothetical protein